MLLVGLTLAMVVHCFSGKREAKRGGGGAGAGKGVRCAPPPARLTILAQRRHGGLVGAIHMQFLSHCRPQGDAKAIPETFIGDGSPNENVERIVAQTVEAIRAEVSASQFLPRRVAR